MYPVRHFISYLKIRSMSALEAAIISGLRINLGRKSNLNIHYSLSANNRAVKLVIF
jgi:hypothetical protein